MERSSKPGQPPGNWHDWPVEHCFLVNSERSVGPAAPVLISGRRLEPRFILNLEC